MAELRLSNCEAVCFFAKVSDEQRRKDVLRYGHMRSDVWSRRVGRSIGAR